MTGTRDRQAELERQRKVHYDRHEKGLSLSEVAEATGYSRSQVCRILAKGEDAG